MIGWVPLILLISTTIANEEVDRSKRFIASYHHVGKECPKICYNHLVHTVAPVDITGLIEVRIARKRRGRFRRHYSSDLEAFQHTCWAYRQYTSKCLTSCRLSPGKAWFQDVFFNILDNYCLTYYDHVLSNWKCFQRIKKFYSICEKECDQSCEFSKTMRVHADSI
uniref:ShKT domain-containing protein n=1 Tax=Steinernema glaseri TaxID=37863 RepID=A0A1I7YIV2_9BILA